MHGLPYKPQLSSLTTGRVHIYLQVLDEHLVVYGGVWWCMGVYKRRMMAAAASKCL